MFMVKRTGTQVYGTALEASVEAVKWFYARTIRVQFRPCYTPVYGASRGVLEYVLSEFVTATEPDSTVVIDYDGEDLILETDSRIFRYRVEQVGFPPVG